MLNSTLERRLTGLILLLAIALLGLSPQRAKAQETKGFPYETLRTPAMGLRGVVATSQPLAANAGLDILQKGGNAFNMIYVAAEDRLVGINASGRAPHAMTLDALNEKLEAHDMDRIRGIYSVELGMNAQQAVEIPRINHGSGLSVTVEPGIDESALAQLEAWGHDIPRRSTRGGVGAPN